MFLYLSADPGIDVEKPTGGGSHIHGTISQLRKMGHRVILVAPGNESTGEGCDFLPVEKHCWFKFLLRVKSFFSAEQKDKQTHPAQVSFTGVQSKDGKGRVQGNSKSGPILSGRIKNRLVYFFYGSFRHHLNRFEETTVYKLRFKNAVKHCIEQERPDGVYERYALGHYGMQRLCRSKKIPHILEVNALLANESRKEHGPALISLGSREKELKFLRSADCVFVVSEQLKADIAPEKASIIVNPNGVDTVLFDPDRVPDDIRKIHGIVQPYVVGWVGSFSLGRGIDAFLDIAEKLMLIQTDICFLIVGNGPLKQWVENQIQARGLQESVVLPGAVPRQKVPLYIAAMDIALAPYPESGAAYFSPLKVFEYMAMGKAIAATDMGQCSTLLKEGAGLLLPDGEPCLWAEKIKQLLHSSQECLAMGEKARQRVLSDYTWEKNALRILQQFARIGKGD